MPHGLRMGAGLMKKSESNREGEGFDGVCMEVQRAANIRSANAVAAAVRVDILECCLVL